MKAKFYRRCLLIAIISFILAGIALIFLLTGCGQSKGEEEQSLRRLKNQQRSIDICIEKGGIPIYSAWDNRLKDCKFQKEWK